MRGHEVALGDAPTVRNARPPRYNRRLVGTAIPDPALLGALERWSREGSDAARAAVHTLLRTSALLVPAVRDFSRIGVPDDVPLSTYADADGRRAAIAFTSREAMKRWRPSGYFATPVPSRRLCELARRPDVVLLIIDLAGPIPFRVTAEELAVIATEPVAAADRLDLDPVDHAAFALRHALELYTAFRNAGNRDHIYSSLRAEPMYLDLPPGMRRLASGAIYVPAYAQRRPGTAPATLPAAVQAVARLGADGILLEPDGARVAIVRGELELLAAGERPDAAHWHAVAP